MIQITIMMMKMKMKMLWMLMVVMMMIKVYLYFDLGESWELAVVCENWNGGSAAKCQYLNDLYTSKLNFYVGL